MPQSVPKSNAMPVATFSPQRRATRTWKAAASNPLRRSGGTPGDAQVLGPVGRAQLELGPRHADVVERHAHRARHLVERIAASFEIRAHRPVALVHPRGEAGDAGAST